MADRKKKSISELRADAGRARRHDEVGRPTSITPEKVAAAEAAAKIGLFKADIARRIRTPYGTFNVWMRRGRVELDRQADAAVKVYELEEAARENPKDAALKASLRAARKAMEPVHRDRLYAELVQAVEGGEGDFKATMLEAATKQAGEIDGRLALRVLGIRDRQYAEPGQARIGGVRVTAKSGEEGAQEIQVEAAAGYIGATEDDWSDVGDMLLERQMERKAAARARASAEARGDRPAPGEDAGEDSSGTT